LLQKNLPLDVLRQKVPSKSESPPLLINR